jgi:hypothetical protein
MEGVMNGVDLGLGTMVVRMPGKSGALVRLGLVPILEEGETGITGDALIDRGTQWDVVRGEWHLYNLFGSTGTYEAGCRWFEKEWRQFTGITIIIPEVIFEDADGVMYVMGLWQDNERGAQHLDFYAAKGAREKPTFGKGYYFLKTMPIDPPAFTERHDDGFLGNTIGP